MPPDERIRLNLLLKIDNPPENKDEEDLKEYIGTPKWLISHKLITFVW